MERNKVEISVININKLRVLKHNEMVELFKRYQSEEK